MYGKKYQSLLSVVKGKIIYTVWPIGSLDGQHRKSTLEAQPHCAQPKCTNYGACTPAIKIHFLCDCVNCIKYVMTGTGIHNLTAPFLTEMGGWPFFLSSQSQKLYVYRGCECTIRLAWFGVLKNRRFNQSYWFLFVCCCRSLFTL